jgi:hypothetical protein
MYATINEFLFPIFLFAVYFCGVSILIYNPEKPLKTQQESPDPFPTSNPTEEDKDRYLAEPLIPGSKSEEIPPVAEEVSISSEPTTPEVDEDDSPDSEPTTPEVDEDDFPDSEVENPLYIQTKAIINNLNKRQSRKICQPLGIKQKCGKAEKSLLSIRTEIENLFKHDPEKVISVIQEKLPELISLPVPTPAMTEMAAS